MEKKTLKILFIGNSYCDFNVMPNQVAALINESGERAEAKRQTKGGASLKDHWQTGVAIERIKNEDYDFVVLQNHSKSALTDRKEFELYGQKFIDLIKTTKAKPILYMTWAREDSQNDQNIITEAYSNLALKNNVIIAPVGEAFKLLKSKYPSIKLHIEDKSHPTMAGSYLAACVFYSTITGKNPTGLSSSIDGYNWVTKGNKLVDLDQSTAKIIQTVAWETVKNFDPSKFVNKESETVIKPDGSNAILDSNNDFLIKDDAIKINFGGKNKIEGWNNIGGEKSPPVKLINAKGENTQFTLEMYDDFQKSANPNVIEGELNGIVSFFKPAADATLFTNSDLKNPTGAFALTLDKNKSYTILLWASRTGNGSRWGKYIVKGKDENIQFMAAGADKPYGNLSQVLIFKNIFPDNNGKITVTVKHPEQNEKIVMGPYVYLTGMIIQSE